MRKRILSMLLALLMLFSAIPANVFAVGEEGETPVVETLPPEDLSQPEDQPPVEETPQAPVLCEICGAADCLQDHSNGKRQPLLTSPAPVNTLSDAPDYSADVGKYVKLNPAVTVFSVYNQDTGNTFTYYAEDFRSDSIFSITNWKEDASGLWYQLSFYRGGTQGDYVSDFPANPWFLQSGDALIFVTPCLCCESCAEAEDCQCLCGNCGFCQPETPENPCGCCESCTGAEGCECVCGSCGFCEKEEPFEPVYTDEETGVVVELESAVEGVSLSVTPADVSAQLSQFGVSGDKKVFALDISLRNADATQYQPNGAVVKVPVNAPAGTIVGIIHDHNGDISFMGVTQVLSDGTVEFVTENFSTFAGFTVDFHYNGVDFSIEGMTSILLSELFTAMGIDEDATQATSVVFSDNTLVQVTQEGNDWRLSSLEAFDTNETLIITFDDGRSIVIDVTDDQSLGYSDGEYRFSVFSGKVTYTYYVNLSISSRTGTAYRHVMTEKGTQSSQTTDSLTRLANMGVASNFFYSGNTEAWYYLTSSATGDREQEGSGVRVYGKGSGSPEIHLYEYNRSLFVGSGAVTSKDYSSTFGAYLSAVRQNCGASVATSTVDRTVILEVQQADGTYTQIAKETGIKFPNISSLNHQLGITLKSNLNDKYDLVLNGTNVGNTGYVSHSNGTYTIRLDLQSYKATATAGYGVASTSGSGTYQNGRSNAKPTFGATLAAGYEWTGAAGWYDGDTRVSSSQSYTFTMPAKDVTYTAKAVPATYTATFNPNGGSVTPTSDTFNIEGALSLPTPTRTGYTFTGWKVTTAEGSWKKDDVYTGSSVAAGKYGNVTLTAQWTANEYDLYFNYNGGKNSETGATSVSGPYPAQTGATSYREVTWLHPAREGYTFDGWYDAQTGGTKVYYGANDKDANGNSLSGYAIPNGSVYWDENQCWKGTTGLTLYAHWSPKSYNVTYQYTGTVPAGVGAVPGQTTKLYGAAGTVAAAPTTVKGYTFSGWSTSDVTVGTDGTFTMPANAVTFTGSWIPKTYTINYHANGGSGSMDSQTVQFNGAITIRNNGFTAPAGMRFAGWAVSATGAAGEHGWSTANKTGWSGTWTFDNGEYGIANDTLNLYAIWEADDFTLTGTIDNGGTVTYGQQNVKGGQTSQAMVFTPATGYKITGIKINGVDQTVTNADTYTFPARTVTEDWEVDVTTDIKTFTVQWLNGTTVLQSGEVSYGDSVTYTGETPVSDKAGYTVTFATWKLENGVPLSGDTVSNVTQDLVISAWFNETLVNYTITYDLDGGTLPAGVTSNQQSYNVTVSATLMSAPTKFGHEFTGWRLETGLEAPNGNWTAGDYTAGQIMPLGKYGNVTLVAQYRVLDRTVTFHWNDGTSRTESRTVTFGTTTNNNVSTLAPTRTGYIFTGWFTESGVQVYDKEGNCITSKNAYWDHTDKLYWDDDGKWNHDGDLALYAHWTANTYKILFDGNGATDGSMDALNVAYDASVQLPANAFARVIQVTYDVNGGKALAADKQQVTLTADFTGWKHGNTDYADQATVKNLASAQDAEVTLLAQWGLKSTVAPTPERDGYTFTGWKVDDSTTYDADETFTPTQNTTLVAQWDAVEYTITYNHNNDLTNPTKETATYKITDDLTLAAAPTREGYKFTGWDLNMVAELLSQGNWTTGDYTAGQNIGTGKFGNITLVAQWADLYRYRVTYNANTTDTVDGMPAAVDTGWVEADKYNVALSATPTRADYDFLGWATSPDAADVLTTCELQGIGHTAKDVTLYAVWQRQTGSLKLTYNGSETAPAIVTVTGQGKTITLVLTKSETVIAGLPTGQYTVTAESGNASYTATVKTDPAPTVNKDQTTVVEITTGTKGLNWFTAFFRVKNKCS